MHICVSKLTIISSDDILWPGHYLNQCWNSFYWTLGNKLQWNLNQIYIFSFMKMNLKMSSGNLRPFCLGLYVLTIAFLTQCSPINIVDFLENIHNRHPTVGCFCESESEVRLKGASQLIRNEFVLAESGWENGNWIIILQLNKLNHEQIFAHD